MLTNVVLPAPLAPIMPTVCSGGTATLMLCAAMSEPKCFSRPRTLRIALMTPFSSGRVCRVELQPPQTREQRAQPLGQEQDRDEQDRAQKYLPRTRQNVVGD